MSLDHPREGPTAIRTNLGAIFVSLELSRSTWLITSLSPGGGEKMSKHSVAAGDIAALLARFSELRRKACIIHMKWQFARALSSSTRPCDGLEPNGDRGADSVTHQGRLGAGIDISASRSHSKNSPPRFSNDWMPRIERRDISEPVRVPGVVFWQTEKN